MKKEQSKIFIYKTATGPKLEVRLEKETIWLTQAQIADLFASERSVITKHLSKIFKEGELHEKGNVQKMHIANSDKPVKFYSLDTVISIGYRVNSRRATQFRIWATKTLKDHLIQGYTINERRLMDAKEKLSSLKETVSFLTEKSKHELLSGQEKELFDLLANYAKTLTILEQYDQDKLVLAKKGKGKFVLDSDSAFQVIARLKEDLTIKKEAGDLFGQEYGDKFKAILGNIRQTFGGQELYQSIEEKAAHLLYFAIKDHPFADGNKRIGSFLFVYFLDKNHYLYKDSGEKKINDNALVALALLIAISNPKDKEVMVKIITNLLK